MRSDLPNRSLLSLWRYETIRLDDGIIFEGGGLLFINGPNVDKEEYCIIINRWIIVQSGVQSIGYCVSILTHCVGSQISISV